VNVRVVTEGANSDLPPRMVHVSFKRKSGDITFYGSIVKDAIKSENMKMFACVPPK
jgi:hypothetical protein